MTFGHIFFIPMTLMVGMLLGFVLGARAARNQLDLERRRDVDRAAARAAREARKAAQTSDEKIDRQGADDASARK